MNPELQKANDMLMVMQVQRDQALNSLVIVQSELMALRRENAACIAARTEQKEPGAASTDG